MKSRASLKEEGEKWILKYFLMGRSLAVCGDQMNVLSCGEWRSLFRGISSLILPAVGKSTPTASWPLAMTTRNTFVVRSNRFATAFTHSSWWNSSFERLKTVCEIIKRTFKFLLEILQRIVKKKWERDYHLNADGVQFGVQRSVGWITSRPAWSAFE